MLAKALYKNFDVIKFIIWFKYWFDYNLSWRKSYFGMKIKVVEGDIYLFFGAKNILAQLNNNLH